MHLLTRSPFSDGSAEIDRESALRPEFVALANNTAPNRHRDPLSNDYLSTLGGVVNLVFQNYAINYYYYVGGDHPLSATEGRFPVEEFMVRDTITTACPSFRDPSDSIMRSFNKLMVRMGAYAATLPLSQIRDKMDPGLVVNSTVTGYLAGTQNVFHTDYRFFIGAAVVELICIALVVPTSVECSLQSPLSRQAN